MLRLLSPPALTGCLLRSSSKSLNLGRSVPFANYGGTATATSKSCCLIFCLAWPGPTNEKPSSDARRPTSNAPRIPSQCSESHIGRDLTTSSPSLLPLQVNSASDLLHGLEAQSALLSCLRRSKSPVREAATRQLDKSLSNCCSNSPACDAPINPPADQS